MSTTASYSFEPADFKASRDAFRDGLLKLAFHRVDAEHAADLFAQVVGKAMAELVPEAMDRMRPVVEAALAWRAASPGSREYQRTADALDAAVDAYKAGA